MVFADREFVSVAKSTSSPSCRVQRTVLRVVMEETTVFFVPARLRIEELCVLQFLFGLFCSVRKTDVVVVLGEQDFSPSRVDQQIPLETEGTNTVWIP